MTDQDTTRQLHDWGHYYSGGFDTVEDVVTDYLSDEDPEGSPLIAAVTAEYRHQLNQALNEDGVYLRGDTFIADVAVANGSDTVIRDVLAHVDLAAIAAETERLRCKCPPGVRDIPPPAPGSIQVMGCGAFDHPYVINTRTQEVGNWQRFYGGGFTDPGTVVRGLFGPNAAPGLVIAVTHRYVEAINRVLNGEGVWLRGEVFHAEPRAVDTADDMITQAFESVDLAGIADVVEAERAQERDSQ